MLDDMGKSLPLSDTKTKAEANAAENPSQVTRATQVPQDTMRVAEVAPDRRENQDPRPVYESADGRVYFINDADEAEIGSQKPDKKAFDLDDFWAQIKGRLEPEITAVEPLLAPPAPRIVEPIVEPVVAPVVAPEEPPIVAQEAEEDSLQYLAQNAYNNVLQAGLSMPNWVWASGALLLASGGSGSGGAAKPSPAGPSVSRVEITSATGMEGGNLSQGDIVTLSVTMSDAVNVSGGTPTLSLTIGNTSKQALYASGSGSSTLIFTYTVEGGLSDTDGISIAADALALNGARIAAGAQAATLKHAAVGDNITYKVDSIAPTIDASSPSFGLSLNSLEDDSDATLSVTTSGVEDGQTLTVTFGEVSLVADVVSNSATINIAASTLASFPEGTVSYTVDVSDAAGQAAVQHTNSFFYDATLPSVTSMTSVGTQGAAKIILNLSEALDTSFSPLPADFVVTIGNAANTVTGVSVSQQTIELTLADSFQSGALVNLEYTPPTDGGTHLVLDAFANPMAGFTKGVLSDGYIRGAKIYLDANADGIASASELLVGTQTDEAGNFFVSKQANPNGYAIIAVGGVNIDTGVTNEVPLSAPAGSLTVNPISTLVQTVISNGDAADADAASAIISAALGLTPGTDLTAFDPLSEIATGGDAGAIAAQKAAVQIVMIVALSASDEDSDAAAEKGQAILSNIANDMAAAASGQTVINLSTPETIASAIGSVAVSDIVKNSITNANTAIQELPDDPSVLADISAVQVEFLDFIAPNAPLRLEFDTPTNDITPTVRIYLDVSDEAGGAVIRGDELFLFTGETLLQSTLITAEDQLAGYADITLTASETKTYALTAYLVDGAQNRSEVSDGSTLLYIDTTPPTAQLSTDVDGLTPDEIAQMTVTFSEAVLGFTTDDIEVSVGQVGSLSSATTLEGGAVQYRFEYTAPSVDQDTFQIKLEANSYTDLAGNIGSQSNAIDLKVDALPSALITDNTPGIASGEVLYSFNFSEAVFGFTQDDISLSGAIAGTFTALSSVFYTYSVIANANSTAPILVGLEAGVVTDASGQGNLSVSAPSQSVDTAAPQAPSIDIVAEDDEISGDEEAAGVDITGSAEAGASVRIEFSGEARQLTADAQTGQWSYRLSVNDFRLMGEGTQSLSVTATDLAGNVSEATQKTITIDTNSPIFGIGQTYEAFDLYGYSADAVAYSAYQASVTALSPVSYSLVDNTSPFRVDANTGSVYFAPDSQAAIADSFKGRASYDLETSYSLTLRATDLFGKQSDHDIELSVLPRVNALASSTVSQGDFETVITDTQDGFRVDYFAPYTSSVIQGDVHFWAQDSADISITWNAIFNDTKDMDEFTGTGLASPQGEGDPFGANMRDGADGEDVVSIGGLTYLMEDAVSQGEILFSLHVDETETLFPTWIEFDDIIMQENIDSQDWSVDLIYASFAPTEVSGSAASEWFDVMGQVTITTGAGPDVLSYNYFTPSLDVAVTDFSSGEDVLDFSPAMNRLGYASKSDIGDAASDNDLRVYVAEASMSDAVLADLAAIFGVETAPDTLAALETGVKRDGLASEAAATALLDNALVALFDDSTSSLMVFADLEASADMTELAMVSWSLGSQIFDPEDVQVFASIAF